ncbi:MAG: GntR family transcriptional regulator [Nocardioidaceae bacterium]
MGDQRDDAVLYRRVAAELRGSIADGAFDDTPLPSESELAHRYGVSRGTVRQAFAVLREEGLLASRQGARRVVVATQVQSFNELRSFSAFARAAGSTPSARLVSFVQRPATEDERRELELPRGADVHVMTRVRLLDGRPVMVERTTLPDAVGRLLADVDPEDGSITSALEGRGVRFEHADHVLSAMAATAQDAVLLEVEAGHPLLRTLRRTTEPAGVPVEWSDDRYLGDAMAFSVHNSVATNPLSRRAQ